MKHMFSGCCLAAMLLVSAGASAQDAMDPSTPNGAIAGRWYVSPMASMTFADNKRNTDDGMGGALLIGKPISPRVNLEGHLFYTGFDGEDGGGNFDLGALGFDVIAFPFDSGLFGIAGLAFGSGDADVQSGTGSALADDNEDSIILDAGLGYLVGPFAFLNNGGLRVEARARFDQRTDSGVEDLLEPVISAGLLYPFGEVAAPPPPSETPVDVVPVGAPADSDGDGVADDLDQCPDTPAGTTVDAKGCPVEAKLEDLGDRSNLDGAVLGDSFILRGVNFDFDKTDLRQDAKDLLDGVTQKLVETSPDVKIEVGGHTDELGTPEYNQNLSERRAKSVSRYLKAGGVANERMTERGYGESQPIAPNDTEEGRAQNRRVELKVLESAY